jgi:hypothetical protein
MIGFKVCERHRIRMYSSRVDKKNNNMADEAASARTRGFFCGVCRFAVTSNLIRFISDFTTDMKKKKSLHPKVASRPSDI